MEEAKNVGYSNQRAFEVEDFLLVEPRPLWADASEGIADIEEVVSREFLVALQDADELGRLGQPGMNRSEIIGEGHRVHSVFPERAEAVGGNKKTDFIEARLLFKMVRINHAILVQSLLLCG